MPTIHERYAGQRSQESDFVGISGYIKAQDPTTLPESSHSVQSVYMTTMPEIEVGWAKANWPSSGKPTVATPFVHLTQLPPNQFYYPQYAGLPTDGNWHSYAIINGAVYGYDPRWWAAFFDGNFLNVPPWGWIWTPNTTQGSLQAYGEVKWTEGASPPPQMGQAEHYLYIMKSGPPFLWLLWVDAYPIIRVEPAPAPPATYKVQWLYNYYWVKNWTEYA